MAVVINGTTGVTTPTESVATTIGVGGATPSASGAGITFPATQSASTNANTLDDYEEGTFTPTGNSITLTVTAASYIKIARLVYFNLDVTVPSTSDTNSFRISGLPFTLIGASNFAGGILAYTDGAGGTNIRAATFLIYAGTNYIDARKSDGSNYTNANFTGSRMILSGCYYSEN